MQQRNLADKLEILTAEQKPGKQSWYEGTADAVRQNIDYIKDCPVDYFLILSGDQIYNFDFDEMLKFAVKQDADITIAALAINSQAAKRLGVLKVDAHYRVTDFLEKPQENLQINELKSPQSLLKKMGLISKQKELLGSMGIYLFKREVLIETLLEDLRADFGKHLIPEKVKQGKVSAFVHDGYWEDIGTVGTFYAANMALLEPEPPFNIRTAKSPICAKFVDMPPTIVKNCLLENSIICEGSHLAAKSIKNSILGYGVNVDIGVEIDSCYIMGSDNLSSPPTIIGKGSCLEKVIVDTSVSIGQNVSLQNLEGLQELDHEYLYIRDGIIIVPRGMQIPDNFKI